MSMEEEQARQAAAAAAAASQSSGAAAEGAASSSSAAASEPSAVPAEPTDDEEAELLKQALAMSEGQDVEMHSGVDEDMSEEDAIVRAVEMSMKPQEEQGEGKDKK